ncbi:MAG: hypothetical protein IJR87_12500 [Bacteroidaceae bacterium]|nr:hypothetical protein [Bacteroidaceae bacterium]
MKKGILTVLLWMAAINASAWDADSQYAVYAPDGVPFMVAREAWNADGLGNHRAVVRAVCPAETKAVRARLKWRRPDLKTDKTSFVIMGQKSGRQAAHFWAEKRTVEEGIVWFEPIEGEDTYLVYYMPFNLRQGSAECRFIWDYNDYIAYPAEQAQTWKASLRDEKPVEATVLRFEGVNNFEAFTQMGNIATAAETDSLRACHRESPVIYTEDRCFPIRLFHQLPVRWVKKVPQDAFEGTAMKNEYYVWQIGLWAAHDALQGVNVAFSDLKERGSTTVIPSSEQTCFNCTGTGWDGQPLALDLNVAKGDVQALWCGIQVPQDAPAGVYEGTAEVTARGMRPRRIALTLHVEDKVLADKGDGDLWRLARLRWLNSTIGSEKKLIPPFKAMKLKGRSITATGRTIQVGRNGLPRSVSVNGRQVLSEPISIEVETGQGIIRLDGGKLSIHSAEDTQVSWSSSQQKQGINLLTEARMEYDGQVLLRLSLSADRDIDVSDIRYRTAYTPYASRYMMGIGQGGGYRPEACSWDWSGQWDSYWMGNTLAGLHTEFRGDDAYHGPLLRDYKKNAPAAWQNGGKSRVEMHTIGSGDGAKAVVTAALGSQRLTKNPLELQLVLHITPAKPLDTRHQFEQRYFHGDPKGFEQAARDGANISNIHHAGRLNPVINYPFIVREPLIKHIRAMHDKGLKVKLYYTIRELTDFVSEIYALHSLNHEIMAAGPGGGAPWLCEHLVEDYWPAWYAEYGLSMTDAAWVTSPQSRWINYYLEGLRWMLQNYEIDGVYMDDISFDGSVMKRMRSVMETYRPGSLIDLHSNTAYSNGPMNQYADYMAFVDRLWFGESFRYNQMTPDQWLITFSGIPFGPMAEMLQDGGNRWLGAVFGATGRYSYDEHSPVPVWQLWKEFGIEEAQMIGWWDDESAVLTSDPEVKATAFVRQGRVLVAVGNFSAQEKSVSLTFDWKRLGLRGDRIKARIPALKNFQDEASYDMVSPLVIPAKQGYIIWIE